MRFSSLTANELSEKGFRMWNKKSNLHLIPLSLYAQIEPGEEVYDIFGIRYEVTSNDGHDCMMRTTDGEIRLDDDTRGGLLAFGVFPCDVEKNPAEIR